MCESLEIGIIKSFKMYNYLEKDKDKRKHPWKI